MGRIPVSHIRLITSGKGGAGKSTVSVYLGGALVRRGRRVLLVEMDSGLRSLDIMLGANESAVFDLADVLGGRTDPLLAAVECAWQPGLWLLPAAADAGFLPEREALCRFFRQAEMVYDYLLVDTPAGLGSGFDVSAAAADSAIVVATPDPISARDAAKTAGLLFERGMSDTKLVINRLPEKPSQMLVPDLDAVIDEVGAQLIGVIPEDKELMQASAGGEPLSPGSLAAWEFEGMAARVEGCYVPLAIR